MGQQKKPHLNEVRESEMKRYSKTKIGSRWNIETIRVGWVGDSWKKIPYIYSCR